jgi:hypothetical protein
MLRGVVSQGRCVRLLEFHAADYAAQFAENVFMPQENYLANYPFAKLT